jgi:hypothetical protein
MRGARGWVLLGIAAVVIAVAAYLGQPHQDSPEHSSNSDAANGTSAALLFAQSIGHPTSQMADSFTPPDSNGGLLFVFTPTSPYTSDEADHTVEWVRSGGVLLYASEQGDAELDRALGVARLGGLTPVGAETAIPVLDGVTRVAGNDYVTPLQTSANQVPVIRTSSWDVVAYVEHLDSGTVFVLADPLVLCNGYLAKRDNGRLLSDLLGLGGAAAPVAFDEYHHGLILSDLAPQPWVATPWGAALLWLLVAVFLGLLLRGRSFGPLIPRRVAEARADLEWAAAVGQLLRRSSARAVTLGLLATATERTVAARTGLPLQPRERFWNALWVRSPALAADLAEAEVVLRASAASEEELLKAAQRLHQIAHPVSVKRPQRRTTSTKEA